MPVASFASDLQCLLHGAVEQEYARVTGKASQAQLSQRRLLVPVMRLVSRYPERVQVLAKVTDADAVFD